MVAAKAHGDVFDRVDSDAPALGQRMEQPAGIETRREGLHGSDATGGAVDALMGADGARWKRDASAANRNSETMWRSGSDIQSHHVGAAP